LALVLIIDDDAPVRRTIRRGLESAGYAVLDAADGREGLDLIGKRRPDLVVVDIVMPETDGLEVVRFGRAAHPAVKFLAISGFLRGGGPDYLRCAQLLGADGILAKPFRLDEMLQVVARLIGPATPTRTGAAA